MTQQLPAVPKGGSASAELTTAGMVSVVIPCYRQARFLPETIASLQRQTYCNWEAIVVDDGSPDDVALVTEDLGKHDPRVRLLRKPNGGPSSARNAGLAVAQGRWIQFLDGDDLLMPLKFERQLAALRTAPPLSMSYTDYWHGAEDDPLRRVESGRLPCRFTSVDPLVDLVRDWELGFSFPIHAPLVDAAFFRKLGIRFNESLRNHEDWDVWMKVVGKASEIHFLAEELAIYRVCAGSNSRNSDQNWSGFRDAIDCQLQHYRDRADVVALLQHKLRLTDWSYSKGSRFQIFNALSTFRPYKNFVPWPLQRWIREFLEPKRNSFLSCDSAYQAASVIESSTVGTINSIPNRGEVISDSK